MTSNNSAALTDSKSKLHRPNTVSESRKGQPPNENNVVVGAPLQTSRQGLVP